jgi:phage terminase large subunit
MPRKATKTPSVSVQEAGLLHLKNNPSLFVREILGAEPEKWQEEALQAIADGDRVAIKSGHGVGKSCFQSWMVLWFLSTHYPAKIVLTANTSAQLNDVLMSEINKWHRRMSPAFREQIEVKSDRVELKAAPTESFAACRTSRRENPEALQGFHADNMLFLIDEASGIDDIVFEVAAGALSTKGAKQVLTGNPTRTSGYFYDAFNKMRENWYCMTVSCEDSTRVDPQFIEDMKKQYGEDSSIYGVRVLGCFPKQDDDVLIPLHIVESAIGRDVEPAGQVVWGLDVARFGADRSCLVKRQGNYVFPDINVWQGKDLMQLCGLVHAEYRLASDDRRPVEIMVDVIGLGAGVVDRLCEMGLPARGVNVGEGSTVKEKYINRRAELWFEMREWFMARDCCIPDDPTLVGELTSPRYQFTSNGKMKMESKEEMKRRGLRSPDVADALVLTMESPAVASYGLGSATSWRGELKYPDLGIV